MSFIRILTSQDSEVLIQVEKIIYVTKSIIGGKLNEDVYDFELTKDSSTCCVTGKLLGGSGLPIKCNNNLIKVQKFLNGKGE